MTNEVGMRTFRRVFLLIATLYMASLLLLMLASSHPVWDEKYYRESVSLVWERGFTKEFFMELPGPPGPMYPWVHALFAPLTSLVLPKMRIVSYLFLLTLLITLVYTLKILHGPKSVPLAFFVMGLPPIYVVSGLALTDAPALGFFSAALLFLLWGLRMKGVVGWIGCLIAGWCFSAAVLARQLYLVPLLLLILPAVMEPAFRGKILLVLLLGGTPFFWLVCMWRGLVPPKTAWAASGINLEHVFLAYFYMGILIAIVSPRWLEMRWGNLWPCIAGGVVVNEVFSIISITPMATLVAKFLPRSTIDFYTRLASHAVLGIATFVLWTLAKKAWLMRNSVYELYFVSVLVFTALPLAAFTHGFHSKYLLGAVPCILLLAAPGLFIGRMAILRLLLGGGIGLAVLSSYIFG